MQECHLHNLENMSDEASSEEDPENYSTIRRGVERMNSDCTLRNRKTLHYKKHYTATEVYTCTHTVLASNKCPVFPVSVLLHFTALISPVMYSVFPFLRRCLNQARAVAHAVPACALRTRRARGTSRRRRICCGRTSCTVQSATPPAPVRQRGRGLPSAPPPKKNIGMTPSYRCCTRDFHILIYICETKHNLSSFKYAHNL